MSISPFSMGGVVHARTTLFFLASTFVCVSPLCAQQFVEEQSTRFPQPAPSQFTNQMSIADVDNDGALDITWAHGCCFNTQGASTRAGLYINDGSGVFTDESFARLFGHGGWFRGVEYGDINSNGYLDSAWANDFNSLPALLVNRGTVQPGYFDNETTTRLPNVTISSSRTQFFDSNNNGHLDLIFTNGGAVSRFGTGFTKLYINDGDGFYTDQSNLLPNVSVSGPMDAKIGDLTNNFDLDVRIGALGNNNSKTFINNGDGTFSNVLLTNSNPPPANITDGSCYSYDMGDINGNGNLDLFGINATLGNSTDLLIRNNGNGTWTNISSQISSNLNVDDNDSKFIDYNNNGHWDLVIARIGGPERLYANNGNGFFTLTSGVIQLVTKSSLDIGVADLTGNGRLDIVVAAGESLAPYTNLIYVNYGPADTIPPKIVRTEQHPNTKDTDGPYVVRAAITDSHSGDQNFYHKGIHINYSHNDGPIQQIPMRFSGGTIYRGEIPGLAPGKVEYYITAIDHNDNLGTGETLSFIIEGDVPVPPCVGDITSARGGDPDGVVDGFDLLAMLGCWGSVTPGCEGADFTDARGSGPDGVVDGFDLLALLGNWGSCPE